MSWHKGAFDLSLMTFGKTDDAKILLLAIGLLSDVLWRQACYLVWARRIYNEVLSQTLF